MLASVRFLFGFCFEALAEFKVFQPRQFSFQL